MKIAMKKKKPVRSRRVQNSQTKALKLLFGLLTSLIISFYFWVADTATSVELPDGSTPLKLYSTELRDDLTLAYTDAIRNAEKSVTLIIYTLTETKIFNALKAKSEEGCSVKVICDAKTSQGIEKRLGRRVKVLKRFTSGLMHQKILIVDGHTTWIGSANMTQGSLRHYGNLVTAIHDKAIATLALAKANSFTSDDRLMLMPHRTFSVADQKIELSFLPDDTLAVERLKSLLQSAKKTVRIAMFTFTHLDLAHEIIKAKKRGVKVEVVVDSNNAIGCGAKVFDLLERNGVSIKCGRGNVLMHHKFMYLDEHILVNGSANWTLRAFSENDDCFFILHQLDEDQRQFMNRLWDAIARDAA